MAIRRYTALFLVLVTTALMASCGTEAKEKATDDGMEGAITVSAAASLTDALSDVKELFGGEHPNVEVDYNFGGSGALRQQITQGAPVDLFFSASKADYQKVMDEGYIDESDGTSLLGNELVLVVHEDNGTVSSFDDLEEAERIAVGNPESVPAGEYSAEAFESMGITEDLESLLIYAEDVRAVLNYVETGNADAGVVYRTDAMTSDTVKIVDSAPEGSHESIIYPVGLLSDSENPGAARAFYDFLKSEESLGVFEEYGFAVE